MNTLLVLILGVCLVSCWLFVQPISARINERQNMRPGQWRRTADPPFGGISRAPPSRSDPWAHRVTRDLPVRPRHGNLGAHSSDDSELDYQLWGRFLWSLFHFLKRTLSVTEATMDCFLQSKAKCSLHQSMFILCYLRILHWIKVSSDRKKFRIFTKSLYCY